MLKRWRINLPLTAVLLLLTIPMANAYTLQSLEDKLPALCEVTINRRDIREGMDFQASLAEPVTFQGQTLPAGALFVGHVMAVHRRGRWGSPHSVAIRLDRVIFDHGSQYALYPNEQLEPHIRYAAKRPDARKQADTPLLEVGEQLEVYFTPGTLKGLFGQGNSQKPVQAFR